MNAPHWILFAAAALAAGCAGTRDDDSLYRPAEVNRATAGNTLEDDYEDREPIMDARELQDMRGRRQLEEPEEDEDEDEDDGDDGGG